MQYKYQLSEEDFLAYQLFNASNSKIANRRKSMNQRMLSFGISLAALGFYFLNNYPGAILFALLAPLTFLFYPQYHRWRFKKHYQKYIKENYTNKINRDIELNIQEDHLSLKDAVSETIINIEDIGAIHETQRHFFVKISTGNSLLIPKEKINNLNDLLRQFSELGIPIVNELNWSW